MTNLLTQCNNRVQQSVVPAFTDEEIDRWSRDEVLEAIQKIQRALRDTAGGVNFDPGRLETRLAIYKTQLAKKDAVEATSSVWLARVSQRCSMSYGQRLKVSVVRLWACCRASRTRENRRPGKGPSSTKPGTLASLMLLSRWELSGLFLSLILS